MASSARSPALARATSRVSPRASTPASTQASSRDSTQASSLDIAQASPQAAMLWWSEWMTQVMESAHAAYVPQHLTQSILRGWTFANNVTINEQNSSSPQAEREIVAQESYGRQLGRVTDALMALIDAQPEAVRNRQSLKEPVRALREMHKKIDRIKEDAADARLARLRADLAWLKLARPDQYAELTGR